MVKDDVNGEGIIGKDGLDGGKDVGASDVEAKCASFQSVGVNCVSIAAIACPLGIRFPRIIELALRSVPH